MADEPASNSFRAALRSGKTGISPDSPLVDEKRIAGDGVASDGLHKIRVSRLEGRRGNHRESDRHRLTEEQVVVRHQGSEHVVALINLSGGGAMVEGELTAGLWDKVELVLGEHGEVECAVRWIRGNRFGLEFAHETRLDCNRKTRDRMLREVIRRSFPEFETSEPTVSDEPDDPATAGPEVHQKRDEARHPLIWNAIVHHDYEWDTARLRNISSRGAMIERATPLPEGATVYVDLNEAGRIAATVCWSRGNQSGLRFHERFDMHRLAKCRPAVAPERWVTPDYLRDSSGETSPWASRWDRLTVEQLGGTLAG
jgi:hypothetical protein